MLRWQSQTIPAAGSSLTNLFDAADDVLIEYADKAENNAVQAKFFDGRRELWQKKHEVASLFNENLSRELFEFLRPAARADAPGAEVLSLVSKDSFERSLALQTICEQAVKKHLELYYALSQRLGVVSGGPATPYEQLPAGPHQLAKVFEGAAGALNVERQVLLALFTLFEREVIRESPLWHHELNEALREAGVLPNLRYELKLDPNRRIRRTDKTDQERQTESAPSAYSAGSFGGARSGTPVGGNRSANPTPPGAGADVRASRSDAVTRPFTGTAAEPASEPALPRYSGFGDPDAGSCGFHADSDAGLTSVRPDAQGGLASTGPGDPLYAGAGEGTRGLGDQLLGRIRELLVAQRSRRMQSGSAYVRPDPAHPASAASVAAAIDSGQVQQASAMPETGVLQDHIQRVVVPRELLEKLRVALATQRSKIKEAVGDDRLSHFDEDTIDIVGMLFEVMLNDDRLNNTVKALLSHLHTPYLKLAVRDRAFLRNREHPARQLLDNMVEAGSRWVDERDLTQGVYPRLQRIVDLVMKAGDRPLMLLQELNEGLAADIKLRSERQQVREVRTVESEKGQARLDEARAAARRATRQFVKASGSPARFQEFLNGPWTDYLTLLYLRSNGNTDTAIWHGAHALCGRLAQCVDALSAGTRPTDATLGSLRGELTHRLGDAIPQYEAKVSQLFDLFSSDHEIAIVAPPPLPEPAQPVKIRLTVGGSALIERLPKLPPGTWVVFHESDGDRVVKLSWFNRKTERFLFVDQAGAKALVVPLKGLADKIDREQAHVLLATGASYVESSLERALNSLNHRP